MTCGPARLDRWAASAAVALVVSAAIVGALAGQFGHPVHAGAAPLFGQWLPHVGPGSPAALAVAVLVIRHGPPLAARLPWSRLLACGYATAVGWTLALSLVDGWRRGVTDRLTTRYEYLSEVGGVTDVPAMVRGFAGRILDHQPGLDHRPDAWTTHVAGHPPGALLVFVGLDRLGLGGGAWAGLLCVLVGATIAISVPVTLRACGNEATARAAVPFLVLFPGAVWVGVSADGFFVGVIAAGVALLATAGSRRSVCAAGGAGVLLAYGGYLSYGLVLSAPVVLVAAALSMRRRAESGGAGRSVPAVAAGVVVGAAAVVAGFTVAGFWWPDGYHLVVQRYYQGLASRRPYAYWVWANLAAAIVCGGPAAPVILRRAAAHVVSRARALVRMSPAERRTVRWWGMRLPGPAVLLPLSAAMAVVAADASGLSKAEVERIWLPFVVWWCAGAALLPVSGRRWWLAAQAATALLVNHLVLTAW